ncbi:MAG: hypothetical protein COV91_02045 [Candidatus Taylorbacteria bacterium CG11_big_fil_rev_8_21_14_0_20_46_11]|uniref:Uncharacterized protein n=1 Tax=Candidatus Taylorbacteria bacterium CG11_big_fil_rev_8_21_14_0_20_46_11 TaxID=1975025 RepID=A0A2H0KC89_9BACT|nr:MAG: hypothetical protein COV91_02045 [Candidatus Taylorbacteria bacterium CG11_big_fil_rev_8_21_14_0_20_46_11]
MTPEQLEKLGLFHVESQRQNIIDIRNWIFQLALISGGIIGFTLPIFNSSPLIKSHDLLIGGLFLLWIEIVFGFGYLLVILSRENNKLAKQGDELVKYHKIESEVRSDAKIHILDILYGVFILATLFIIISMIDF